MKEQDMVYEDFSTEMSRPKPDPKYSAEYKTDNVNSPIHYNKNSHGIECIQAIRAALTDEEFRGYCKGNVLKYTWRENYKNKVEDLEKASWYLNKLIESIKK